LNVLKILYVFVTVALLYPYFDVVVGLVWSFDPESCVGCSEYTSNVFHASQVKGDDPDKKGYPGPPGWGLGVRLVTSPHKKYICVDACKIGTRMETTNMALHQQGFISRDVEYIVSVYKFSKCHHMSRIDFVVSLPDVTEV
jgi:hypothetical protein